MPISARNPPLDAISRQEREIGIRKAMGAAPTHVAWFFARRALGPPLAGILAGLGGALALYGALTKVVAGIDRWDSASFAWTPAMLLAAALAAVVIPLRRALRIDPAVSLRSD